MHGEWMLRAYAVNKWTDTQVLMHLPYVLFVGQPVKSVRAVLIWRGA
jgi:hypothetical protein